MSTESIKDSEIAVLRQDYSQHLLDKLRKEGEFRGELITLINKHSLENLGNTPDFIIADYLIACIKNLAQTISSRERYMS